MMALKIGLHLAASQTAGLNLEWLRSRKNYHLAKCTSKMRKVQRQSEQEGHTNQLMAFHSLETNPFSGGNRRDV